MKTFLVTIMALFMTIGCSKVPAGNVGVKVYLLGGDKGVDTEELGVGRYWIGFNEDLYLFPTFQQNYVWTMDYREGSENDESFTFQTKEGLTVGADIGISYHIAPDKVNTIFQKYRRGVDEITDVFLRNMVRDALNTASSTVGVEYVYGAGKAELIENVQTDVMSQVSDLGINVDKIYLIGSFRLPNTVVSALNQKIEATQRAVQRENEVREAEAEAQKQIAEAHGVAQSMILRAEAEAKSLKLKNSSLTPQLIQYESVMRWDGNLPRMTGGAIPFVNMDNLTTTNNRK